MDEDDRLLVAVALLAKEIVCMKSFGSMVGTFAAEAMGYSRYLSPLT